MDSLKCQTSAASPAEPGELPCWFSLASVLAALTLLAPLLPELAVWLRATPSQASPEPPAPPAPQGASRVEPPADAAPAARVVRVYRWRDERGVIHYESSPPPPGVRAEILVFQREPPRRRVATRAAPPEPPTPAQPSPLSVYLPEGREELRERLEATLKALRERDALLQRLEGEL